MEVTASVSCLIVWAVLSLAYIRYLHWLKLCDKGLQDDLARSRRSDPKYTAWTLFSFIQPIPAYIGLIGSLLIVGIFTSAPWWNGTFTWPKFFIAYGAPIVIALLWLFLKLYRWYISHNDAGWVRLDNNAGRLQRCIIDLTWRELQPGPRSRDAWPQSLRAALRRRMRPTEDPDPASSPPPHAPRIGSHEMGSLPNGTVHGRLSRQTRTYSSQYGSPAEDQDGSAHAIHVVDTGPTEVESG